MSIHFFQKTYSDVRTSDITHHAMNNLCSHYQLEKCRSCSWMDIPHLEQLSKKTTLLQTALPGLLDPISTYTSRALGFRNRAKLQIAGTSTHAKIGFYPDPKNLTLFTELIDCPLHFPEINQVLEALPAYIEKYNLIPYDISSQKGELKGVILFYSPESQQMYLRFVLRSQECVFRIKKLILEIQNQFSFLQCITANIQPIPHAFLEGPTEFFLTQKKTILHKIGPYNLELSPCGFSQTNFEISHELYQKAASWVQDLGLDFVLDLYCGQGFFSFFLSPFVKKILGVEENSVAIQTAETSAKKLKTKNLEFICTKAAEIEAILQSHPNKPELILVNPPRRGLGEALSIVLKIKPQHLIYSSCSLPSLTQDLKSLSEHYTIKKAALFDMFPHTPHFETLLWLERKK